MPYVDPNDRAMFEKKRLKLFAILLKLSYEWRAQPFVLKSGAESHQYMDCRQTSLHPEGAKLIGELYWFLIQHYYSSATAVGGLTVGADPLVTATSIASCTDNPLQLDPLTGLIVREAAKAHGSKDLVVGGKFLPADTITVVVDDVLTSGGSLLQAFEALQARGFSVAGALVIVDRQEQDGRAKVLGRIPSLFTLFRLQDFARGEPAPFVFT